MTFRPASASSAAATRPASPAPTTMASASTRAPSMFGRGYYADNGGEDSVSDASLHGGGELVPPDFLQRAAQRPDRAGDGRAEPARVQGVFDRGRGFFVLDDPLREPNSRLQTAHDASPFGPR